MCLFQDMINLSFADIEITEGENLSKIGLKMITTEVVQKVQGNLLYSTSVSVRQYP